MILSLTSTRPCPLCSQTSVRLFYERPETDPLPSSYRITEASPTKPKRLVLCQECGLLFSDPPPDLEALGEKYAEMEDLAYLAEERGRRRMAHRLLKIILRHRRGGRLLDVGCACGFLLDEARQLGWEVYGVEPSRWAADYAAKRLKLSVHLGLVEELKYPEGWFDVIVLTDTLEHLFHPRDTLESLRHILAPNGILVMVTPDVGGLTSRLLGIRWWGIQEAHLGYFNRKSLRSLLERSGFSILQWMMPPRTFSWAYWAQRLAPYLPTPRRRNLEAFARRPAWHRRLATLQLFDQVGCLAHRARTVALIPEWEKETSGKTPIPQAKVVAVLPAYNAAKTLQITVRDIPREVVHEVLVVDDASRDETVSIARQLNLPTLVHKRNRGYGAGQKTGYQEALRRKADLVVMVHPDYQYDPRTLTQLVAPIQEGWADVVFGSRMMKGGALEGGMPYWKWVGNILLTTLTNVVSRIYLTEIHSGFRAYSAQALRSIRFEENSDGFIFDTQIILQFIAQGFRITEIPIRTRYFDEASSIRLWPAFLYGLKILANLFAFWIHRQGLLRIGLFTANDLRPSRPSEDRAGPANHFGTDT